MKFLGLHETHGLLYMLSKYKVTVWKFLIRYLIFERIQAHKIIIWKRSSESVYLDCTDLCTYMPKLRSSFFINPIRKNANTNQAKITWRFHVKKNVKTECGQCSIYFSVESYELKPSISIFSSFIVILYSEYTMLYERFITWTNVWHQLNI